MIAAITRTPVSPKRSVMILVTIITTRKMPANVSADESSIGFAVVSVDLGLVGGGRHQVSTA